MTTIFAQPFAEKKTEHAVLWTAGTKKYHGSSFFLIDNFFFSSFCSNKNERNCCSSNLWKPEKWLYFVDADGARHARHVARQQVILKNRRKWLMKNSTTTYTSKAELRWKIVRLLWCASMFWIRKSFPNEAKKVSRSGDWTLKWVDRQHHQ